MRYIMDQWEQEGIFVTHQHHGVFTIPSPTFLQDVVQKIREDVGVGRDGLDPASKVNAVYGFVGKALSVGSSNGSLFQSEEGYGAEFGSNDECGLSGQEELTQHGQVIFLSCLENDEWIYPVQKCSIELIVDECLSHQRQLIVHSRYLRQVILSTLVELGGLDVFLKQRSMPNIAQLRLFLEYKVNVGGCPVECDDISGMLVSKDDEVVVGVEESYECLLLLG